LILYCFDRDQIKTALLAVYVWLFVAVLMGSLYMLYELYCWSSVYNVRYNQHPAVRDYMASSGSSIYLLFVCRRVLQYLLFVCRRVLQYLLFVCRRVLQYLLFVCRRVLQYLLFVCRRVLQYLLFVCQAILKKLYVCCNATHIFYCG
jgi:hypothetical protein